ncbi:YciI family protein [Halopseudomonas pachastrellae]|nr:YciI family protein [Halopseudomonas pachastrellae]
MARRPQREKTHEYLFLVYYDEKKMQQLSQDEWDALNRECIACVAGLQASGHCLEGAPLLSTETATTVRVRDGGPLITDGPFAETKEQLRAFICWRRATATKPSGWRRRFPPARYGSVEIRPVRELMEEGNRK